MLRISTFTPISSNFSLPGLPGKKFTNAVLSINMEQEVTNDHVYKRRTQNNEVNTHFCTVNFQCQERLRMGFLNMYYTMSSWKNRKSSLSPI